MFKKLSLCLILPFLFPAFASAADKYDFDKSHTHIIFLINHLGFSNTIGRLKEYEGHFTFDEKSPESSSIDVTLKADSIDTSVAALNKELMGEKFFNVEKFPTLHFKSTKVTITGPKTADVAGDFTMLGVTKPLTLHVVYNKSGIHPYTNNYVSGFTADAKINRSEFGMNAFMPAVGDEVSVHIEVEGINPVKHPGNVKTPG